MLFIDRLAPAEKDLLTGIVYRAGLWISYCEDEAGTEDDHKEARALEDVLKKLAAQNNAPLVVSTFARLTLEARARWADWENHIFNLPADCREAMQILRQKAKKAEIVDYQRLLFHVARAVASAYGEFGEFEAPKTTLGDRIAGIFRKEVPLEPFMNISATEMGAIEKLQEALKG